MPNAIPSMQALPEKQDRDRLASEGQSTQGPDVTITFELPKGNTFVYKGSMGQNVEFLKGILEKEHSIPYAKQVSR